MRLVLATARSLAKPLLVGLVAGVVLAGLAACPAPPSPKGPPPLYEEPPAPSWLERERLDAGAAADGGGTS